MGFTPVTDISYVHEQTARVERLPSIAEKLMDLANSREAASHLGVSEGHLRKLVAQRTLPFFLIDGQRWFSKADLDVHIAKKHLGRMREQKGEHKADPTGAIPPRLWER